MTEHSIKELERQLNAARSRRAEAAAGLANEAGVPIPRQREILLQLMEEANAEI